MRIWMIVRDIPVPGLIKAFAGENPSGRFQKLALQSLGQIESGDPVADIKAADIFRRKVALAGNPPREQAEPIARALSAPDDGLTDLTQKSPLIQSLQRSLARLNCHRAAIDGFWGPNTRASLVRFQRQTGLSFDVNRPDADVLAAVEAEDRRVCKLRIVKKRVRKKLRRVNRRRIERNQRRRFKRVVRRRQPRIVRQQPREVFEAPPVQNRRRAGADVGGGGGGGGGGSH